jgi:hypothetical protein
MYYRVAVSALAGLSLFACADASDMFRNWNVNAGVVFTQIPTLTDAFWEDKVNFGLSPNRKPDRNGWLISPDVNVIYNESRGNRILIVPLTVGVANRSKVKGSDWTPYIAARVGAAYTDYRIDFSPSSRLRDNDWVMNANAEVGAIYKDSLRIRARYDWYRKTNGLLLDGLSLNISWTAIRF